MNRIEIDGGYPLHGEVAVQGSKNAVLPMIAATLLHKGISTLHNCPKIIDVFYMAQILRDLGCQADFEGSSLVVDATEVTSCEIDPEYAGKMRSSIIMLGGMLGRIREARVAHPGGCVIGKRPIDLHLKAFEQMQVELREKDGILYASAPRLHGADIRFSFPSVGATENAVLAAACADGDTVLRGCACEPEIIELCSFLNAMGASVSGGGTDTIHIHGVRKLHDVEYDVAPDRIVAGTYVLAAVGTRGVINLKNPPAKELAALGSLVEEMGGTYELSEEGLFVDARRAAGPVRMVTTSPYPGFPTDMQSQLMAALTKAEGRSTICENIFEDRFKIIPELQKLGADIDLADPSTAVVRGVKRLHGAQVEARELRGGAALVIAGLMAEGHTIVEGKEFINRGYVDICTDFRLLGGHIR